MVCSVNVLFCYRNLQSQLEQIQSLGSSLKTDKESVQSAVEKLSTSIEIAIRTIKTSPKIKVTTYIIQFYTHITTGTEIMYVWFFFSPGLVFYYNTIDNYSLYTVFRLENP